METGRSAILIVLTAMLYLSPVASADTLVPHTATYKVRISVASGTLKTIVREAGDRFEVSSTITPTGLARLLRSGRISEMSIFAADENGVRPRVYMSRDTLSSDETQMNFNFDWDANSLTGTVNDELFEYPLDQQVHDRVSIQYQLMHNLMTGSPGNEYALLDDDELKQISVRSIGEKEIKVPYGTFKAVGIQHQAANSRRVTTLWCAEELGYLPVLIEQRRKGKVQVRAMLSGYTAGQPGETSVSASN